MVILFSVDAIWSQTYIMDLDQSEKSFRQRLARFDNGDLLIGDSYFAGSKPNGPAAILLTRMDKCGTILWSKIFPVNGIQLLFKDFVINRSGEIFVFGSYISGPGEAIFLMKVQTDGSEALIRAYRTPSAGTSSFSISLQNDNVLVSGRILEIGSETTGYLAMFNQDLSWQWARKITPFTFEGKSIFTSKAELLLRSEGFHYKFDSTGNLLWAQRFERSLDPSPIGGPFSVRNGYVFEAFDGQEAFFYKLDEDGNLIWKSPRVPSTDFSADVKELSSGDLIMHFTAPEAEGTSIRQLQISSAGNGLSHQKLASDFSFNVGSTFQSFINETQVNLVVNDDALPSGTPDFTQALLQVSVESHGASCSEWIDAGPMFENDLQVTFSPVDANVVTMQMEEFFASSIAATGHEGPYRQQCGTTIAPEVTSFDTLLDCTGDWMVALPSIDFIWEDGYPEFARPLASVGTYRARNDDCLNPKVYEFKLDRSICDCLTYLPNAFTPNQDGLNDFIELSSDCQIISLETRVIDRWGNLISLSSDPGVLWDGKHNNNEASPGVYIVLVNYQLLSDSGGLQEGSLVQDVVLLK